MPCRDYGDENNNWQEEQLREQNDKLARIACKAMELIESEGIEDFLLLEDAEVREWWTQHKIDDAEEAKRVAERKKFIEEATDLIGEVCQYCKKGKNELSETYTAELDMMRCDMCYRTNPRYVK